MKEYLDGSEWMPEDWNKINIESYKFSVSHSKDRHDAMLSESFAITSKTMDIIKVNLVLFSAFITFGLNSKFSFCLLFAPFILFVYIVYVSYINLKSKNIYERGGKPKEFFNKNIDNENYNCEDIEKSIYYNLIVDYDFRIEEVNKNNQERIKNYNNILIFTIVLLITCAGITGTSLYVS